MTDALQFKRAVKRNLYAHIAILGPSGSGKTYTGLRWAYALAPTGKIAAIDTEHGSLSKYAGEKVDGKEWRPDVIELDSFAPENYITAIKLAEKLGYEVLLIDSLSHAWAGKDGVLEFVDIEARKSPSSNSFAAWRKGTPLQNKLVEAMMAAKLHLIVTMRVKSEYVLETNERGKQAPRKIGLQPIQREGIEYEFDLVCDMQDDNSLRVSKSRCSALNGKFYDKPGAEPMAVLVKWLTGEAEAVISPTPEPVVAPEAPSPKQEIIEPPSSASPSQPAPKQAEAKPAPTRPYSPEQLKSKVDALIAKSGKSALLPVRQYFTVVEAVENLFPLFDKKQKEEARHAVLFYLVGTTSVKEMTVAQADAIKAWAVTNGKVCGEALLEAPAIMGRGMDALAEIAKKEEAGK